MKKIAVILSGCGVQDGSEIYESVLTLLYLDKAGVQYQCLAPNIEQRQVVNHQTGDSVKETRNVLVESARIARGEILDVAKADPADYDALILPGGFGAALNLCDFAVKGADCSVQPDVLQFAQAVVKANKPVGFICIAPAMVPLICGAGTTCTIGNDEGTAQAIEAMGAQHQNCEVHHIVIDQQRKVVSTPAYMLAGRISEAAAGIEKLVAEVVKLA